MYRSCITIIITKPNNSMSNPYQNLSMEELVEILAQKTQVFTQLLVGKKFNGPYKEVKEAIHQILAEIELRKEASVAANIQSNPKGS